jgi:hypothetical protein
MAPISPVVTLYLLWNKLIVFGEIVSHCCCLGWQSWEAALIGHQTCQCLDLGCSVFVTVGKYISVIYK